MIQTIKKVQKYICDNDMLDKSDTVIVGLSGGADSVCLLNILNKLSKDMDFNLKAVHVHHGIRGEEADADQSFVSDLCRSMNVPLMIFKRDIPREAEENHETEEECGRRVRYEIFGDLAKEAGNGKIAVAHHMDDQVETILFRMLRGTGIKGISGMRPVNGNIIRPMLCLTREEILAYLQEEGQVFRTDSTNEDISYSRNYIRKKIIPEFKEINDRSIEHIVELGRQADEINSYLEEEADKLLEEADGNSKQIWAANPVLRSVAIRRFISNAGVPLKDVSRQHIAQIEDIISGEKSALVHLPKGYAVRHEAGRLSMIRDYDESKGEDYFVPISGEGIYEIAGEGRVICRLLTDFTPEDIPCDTYTKWLDYDKIKDGLCVRNRRSKDRIVINEKGNTKGLKDYMINEKIPQSLRDRLPLIAGKSGVYWVIGHRIGESSKVTKDTKRVMEISFEKENDHG